jgi:hypothetical protein
MALSGLPPWLQISPEQFVRAASEGAQAGLAVARLNREADEAAQRAGQQGREFEEAQALRQWEQQQQMQMHAQQMQAAQKKSEDELAARTMYQRSMMEARVQAEKDRQTAQTDLKDYRSKTVEDAVKRMENLEAHRKEIESVRKEAEARQEKTAADSQALREQNAALRGQAEYTLKAPDGSIIKGKASDPAIAELLAKPKAASDAAAQPGFLKRAWNTITGSDDTETIPPVGTPDQQRSNRTLLGPGGYLTAPVQAPMVSGTGETGDAFPAIPTGPQSSSGSTKKFQDASGKTWTYTGTADNPLTDTDVSHWQE